MIAVVFLVWGPLGPGRLQEFVTSYRSYRSGIDHDLIVIYNGVGKDQRPALDAELERIDHQLIELASPLLDVAAYAQAAARLSQERLCFLNSYSVILAPDWLAKLDDVLNGPRAGLVGATGSWASHRSARMNSLFLPNPYRALLPNGRFRHFPGLERALDIERSGSRWSQGIGEPAPDESKKPRPLWYITKAVRALARTPGDLRNFETFPSHHVRTNAFMMRRTAFGRVRMGRIKSKADAYVLESGRNGLTRQVEQQGLRTLVVASDGAEYEPNQWPLSETFWQSHQDGLLIGDNQTRLYERAPFDRRRFLSALAWGSYACPQARGDAPMSGPW